MINSGVERQQQCKDPYGTDAGSMVYSTIVLLRAHATHAMLPVDTRKCRIRRSFGRYRLPVFVIYVI